jgi:signal transduction histidine kinase/DNA-binding response OmpR family regulator
MEKYLKRCLIILLLLALIILPVFPIHQGKLLVKNYRLTDYGSRGNTAWAIVKDKRGVLYFGCEGAVIEYDGTSWRSIDLPNKSVVRSLAIDDDGIIYVGGVSEFGYLQPDDNGNLYYVSLIHKVPQNKRSFPDVWSINVLDGEVLFQSAERLFRYKEGELKILELSDSYHRSFVINDCFYINQKQIGLCYLIQDSIMPVPGGAFFRDKEISYMSLFDDGIILVGTRRNGLFLYNSTGQNPKITSLENTQSSQFLMKNHLYHGTELPGDRFAYASLRNGTIIADKQGNILNYINPYSGSGDFSSYFLYLSNESELWIASSQGISLYNINSPLSYWNEETGLIGISNCVIEHKGKIYVGTYSGLFSLDFLQDNNYERDKLPIGLNQTKNLDTEVWDFMKFDPTGKFEDQNKIQLLAATGKGLYNVDKKTIEFVTDRVGILRLCQSRFNPSIIYLSTHPTFYVLQYYNNKWNVIWDKEVSSYVQSVVEDNEGNVWLGTMYYGVFRIGFDKVYEDKRSQLTSLIPKSVFDSVSITGFTEEEGLPNINKTTTHIFKGELIISCDGFFTYDKKLNRFIRSDRFGKEVMNWNKTVDDFEEDMYGNIWGFHAEIFDKQLNGQYQVIRLPFQMLMVNGSTLDYYHDQLGSTWIAGEDYLLKYDSKTVRPANTNRFYTLIRKVSINNDSVIFYGSNFTSNNEKRMLVVEQSESLIPEIKYKSKYISFEYACPYFQDDIPLEYSYYLEGYDEKWSNWTYATRKEYNNLHESSYLFRVKARNYAGEISEEGTYRFVITPPWHRSILMYIMYGTLFFIILYLSIKIYGSRLKRYNVHLEQTVQDRTAKLLKQKEEIDYQSRKLKVQNEKLINQRNRLSEMSKAILKTNQDKLKFFTNISHEIRTPLTLILSPIEELMDPDRKLSQPEEKKKIDIIHKNANRLLSLVNQIMDLRKLEIQTTNLRATQDNIVSFVSDIVSCFQDLAEKTDIELLFLSEEKEIITWFDHDKIEKILSNLMSNAFKYTEEGGRIYVKVSLETEKLSGSLSTKTIHILVSDTGIGIEEEVIPNIFNIFYHSGNSVSLDQAGIGIGLNMAATLAEIHHGKIDVKSQVGKGSDFTLSIPYGEEYLKGDEKEYDEEPDNIYSYASRANLEILNYLNVTTRKKKTEVDKERKNKLVLLVEDSEDIRSYIMSSLADKYDFIEAENGVEGFDLAIKNHPDVIITDIIMPEMDGYEFCSKIKSSLEISDIPVIILTYKFSDEDQRKGLEMGADAYIPKPFNMNLLEARIENLIQTRNELREKFRKELIYKPAEIVITSKDEKFISKALQVVEKHISNPGFDVVSFSKEMAMSQSTLYRKLKTITGESTNNFIKDLRLKQAANLLGKNDLAVSEVSLMVGFDDPAYFAKSFKQKFGKSPSEYSKALHSGQ